MENKIKEVIKSRRRHLKYIAERVGISDTELSNYIAGRRKPTNERLLKMASILNCRVTELYPNARRRITWDLG